jgi:prepilin-type N-terminal cleavage/methylation domain-containing protein
LSFESLLATFIPNHPAQTIAITFHAIFHISSACCSCGNFSILFISLCNASNILLHTHHNQLSFNFKKMEKRKITKFRPLCPSDISPYKGATKQKVPPIYKELISSFPRLLETKQEVPPLYKGRLGGVCAFTLVELIVVVTILAIL